MPHPASPKYFPALKKKKKQLSFFLSNISFLCFFLEQNSLNVFSELAMLISQHFLLNPLCWGFCPFPCPAPPQQLLSSMPVTFALVNPVISSCFFSSLTEQQHLTQLISSLSLSLLLYHCFLDFFAFSLFCPLYSFSGWSHLCSWL